MTLRTLNPTPSAIPRPSGSFAPKMRALAAIAATCLLAILPGQAGAAAATGAAPGDSWEVRVVSTSAQFSFDLAGTFEVVHETIEVGGVPYETQRLGGFLDGSATAGGSTVIADGYAYTWTVVGTQDVVRESLELTLYGNGRAVEVNEQSTYAEPCPFPQDVEVGETLTIECVKATTVQMVVDGAPAGSQTTTNATRYAYEGVRAETLTIDGRPLRTVLVEIDRSVDGEDPTRIQDWQSAEACGSVRSRVASGERSVAYDVLAFECAAGASEDEPTVTTPTTVTPTSPTNATTLPGLFGNASGGGKDTPAPFVVPALGLAAWLAQRARRGRA